MDDGQAAARTYFRHSELSPTTLPAWREQILGYDPEQAHLDGRSYPGYPSFPLPRQRRRPFAALDQALFARRSARRLHTTLPTPKVLGRLLQYSHGSCANNARGPVPSAGGLQALELYVVALPELPAVGPAKTVTAAAKPPWLPSGLYHYDRARHLLAQISPVASRLAWHGRVPSMDLTPGGALLWVIVGDEARVAKKYGARGNRFLLLEAGHLMQNLCLLSTSLDLCTVPLGGYLETEVAREFLLPRTDVVLYLAVCGAAD